jgi:hypothetical protein|tara:strand:+ start:349 stop:924 length:576 start_codon:yes stop_codon:yes gene_type:complete
MTSNNNEVLILHIPVTKKHLHDIYRHALGLDSAHWSATSNHQLSDKDKERIEAIENSDLGCYYEDPKEMSKMQRLKKEALASLSIKCKGCKKLLSLDDLEEINGFDDCDSEVLDADGHFESCVLHWLENDNWRGCVLTRDMLLKGLERHAINWGKLLQGTSTDGLYGDGHWDDFEADHVLQWAIFNDIQYG